MPICKSKMIIQLCALIFLPITNGYTNCYSAMCICGGVSAVLFGFFLELFNVILHMPAIVLALLNFSMPFCICPIILWASKYLSVWFFSYKSLAYWKGKFPVYLYYVMLLYIITLSWYVDLSFICLNAGFKVVDSIFSYKSTG